MADWRRGVLKAIGAPATPQNLRFLSNWQRWEGGHTKNDARFNWLNTTRGPGRSINSVGVKAFSDFQTGVRYTAETLINGRYDDIVAGLVSGNPYGHDVSRGLQVWVSGRPDGNPEYASKVLGGARGGMPEATRPRTPSGVPAPLPPPQPPRFRFPREFIDDIFGEELGALYARVSRPQAAAQAGRGREAAAPAPTKTEFRGDTLVLPTQWNPTHVTDGLGWGSRSAIDIMGDPGTPVGAPEDGVVMRWNPTGAQGGGSMWFKAKSGKTYWIGHIAEGLRPGTRVKRGQVIAAISPDHPRPHVHLDRRG